MGLEHLAWACEAVQLSSVTPAERQRANQVCEEALQADPVSLVQLGTSLCQPSNAVSVRFFGLKCMERAIEAAWQHQHAQTQLQVREQVLRLVVEGMAVEETGFVREKAGWLVVNLAERAWPQHWPQLVPDLVQFASAGVPQLRMCLIVLRGILQDGVDGDRHLSERRRQEMLTSLNHHLTPHLNPFLQATLATHLEPLSRAPDAVEAATHVAVVSECLVCLRTLCSWISSSDFAKSGLTHVLCQCVLAAPDRCPELRAIALEALVGFHCRRFRSEDCEAFAGTLEQVSGALAAYRFDRPFSEQEHNALCLLARLLACVVGHRLALFDRMGDEQRAAALPQLHRDLQLALHLSTHPSVRLSGDVFPVWCGLFTNPHALKTPLPASVLPALLPVCLRRLVKHADPFGDDDDDDNDNNNGENAGDGQGGREGGGAVESGGGERGEGDIAKEYSLLDFSSQVDFQAAHGKMTTEVMRVVRHATLLFFAPCLQFAMSSLADAARALVQARENQPPAAGGGGGGGGAGFGPQSPLVLQLNAAAALAEQALLAIEARAQEEREEQEGRGGWDASCGGGGGGGKGRKSKERADGAERASWEEGKPALCAQMDAMARLALGMLQSLAFQPTLFLQPIRVLRVCFCVHHPSVDMSQPMQATLHAFFSLVTLSQDDLARDASLGGVQRAACHALIHLCDSGGVHAVGFLNDLVARVGSVVGSPQHPNFVRAHLFDALVALSNHMPSAQAQEEFVRSIVHQFAAELQQAMPLVSSPAGFALSLGLHHEKETEAGEAQRRRLGFCLRVVVCTFHRCRPLGDGAVLDAVSVAVLPWLLGMVRCVHGLECAGTRSRFHPAHARVLDLSVQEINQTLGYECVAPPGGGGDAPSSQVLQRWIAQARDQGYRCVGHVARKTGLMGNPQHCQLACEALLSFLASQPTRHLATLLDLAVLPMAKCARSPTFACLSAALVVLLRHCTATLRSAWDGHARSHAGGGPGDGLAGNAQGSVKGEEALMEVVRDKEVRTASRALQTLAYAIVTGEGGSTGGGGGGGGGMGTGGGSIPSPRSNTTNPGHDSTLPASAFGWHVVASPDVGTEVAGAVALGITWPDSVASARALKTLQALLALVDAQPAAPAGLAMCDQVRTVVLGLGVRACVGCCALPSHKSLLQDLTNTAVDLVVTAQRVQGQAGTAALVSLAAATGGSESDVQQLLVALSRAGDKRKRRQVFRQALDPLLRPARQAGDVAKIDIAELLQVYKPPAPPVEDDDAGVELDRLFEV